MIGKVTDAIEIFKEVYFVFCYCYKRVGVGDDDFWFLIHFLCLLYLFDDFLWLYDFVCSTYYWLLLLLMLVICLFIIMKRLHF